MIERHIYGNIQKIENPTLRNALDWLARLVLDNWFYVLALIFLLRFPYMVADWTDSEVMPRRPSGDSVFWQSEMARALALACLAMSYNLLFGFSGIISFGHALFFGTGSYVTFMLLNHYDPSLQRTVITGVVLILLVLALFTKFSTRALLIAGLAAVALALILLPGEGNISFYQAAGVALVVSISISLISGLVTLRLRGIYFTMFTLALAEMFWVLAKSGTFRNYTGAEDGLGFRAVLPEVLNPTQTFDGNRLDMYRLTVVFFVIVFLAIRRYLNSPVGRVIMAIRENEERARTIGYNTLYYKVLTMAFAGTLASLSGLLFVIWATDKRVHPEALSLKYTVAPLLNTLLGGVGTLTGPVFATLGLQLGETYLRNETFTMDTQLLGIAPMWAVFTTVVVALVMWAIRRYIVALGERIQDRRYGGPVEKNTSDYRRFMLAFNTGTFALLLVIGLIVGYVIYDGSDVQDEIYEVSDLWQLFLGLVFVIVVMILPNGIVGTWNRVWAERRIRRIERDLARQKETST
ncbi:MAG: branched-chain amino acid ABC transporter permease [Anaerolineae bacterium]|nr:branched-chain amino acid ABC transporter permease [Anaerolineae bacterium]